MASADRSVWVGFIEGLPIIGSMKEAVEWILAVAADDLTLAKEKMQAINGKVQVKGKHRDHKSSGSDSGYSTAASSGRTSPERKRSAGWQFIQVEEISTSKLWEHIIEVMGKHGKQKGKPTMKPDAHRKELRQIQAATIEKIHKINQNFKFQEPLRDVGNRSKRGEHVINNGVIKFLYKAAEDYTKKTFVTIALDGASPLSEQAQNAIMYEMVAHFNEDELYVNANAVVYGEYCSALRNALNDFLDKHYQEGWEQDDKNESINHVNYIVHHFNGQRAYVDELALVKWVDNKSKNQAKFDTTKAEVASMFTNWRDYFQPLVQKVRENQRRF